MADASPTKIADAEKNGYAFVENVDQAGSRRTQCGSYQSYQAILLVLGWVRVRYIDDNPQLL